jgi:tape measure domain-containing protein
MAATEQKFNIKVATQGTESLTTLKAKLANLGKEVNATKIGFQGAAAEIKKVQSNTDQSVNSLRNFASSWRELANSVSITSKEFRTYTREAEKAERIAARASRKPGMGGRGLAQSIGTVAASGVFGGPEGAIGSLIGLPFGPGGAAAGGAAGAQLGMIRQAVGDMAVYAASLNKLQIALKGVTGSATEYAYAQQAINNVSQQLNIPILEATQGFTRLTASVIGAGGKVADAEVVFNGMSRAIKATGGGAEDVSGALLALSQVFSKGKVSAEELNQIAERLPGTYTTFAKAAQKNGPQLAKALQSGTVGLNDLMKFAILLNDRYAKSADKMAKAQEDAGARMTTSLDKLKAKFGNFFIPVGAAIQTFIGKLADMATATIVAFETTDKYTKARNQATEEAVKKYGPGTSAIQILFGAKDNTSAINTYINKRAKELYDAMQKTNPSENPELTTFENLTGDGGPDAASNAAENKAKRLAEQIRQQIDAAIKLDKIAQADLDIQVSMTDEEKLQGELDKVKIEREIKFGELRKKSLSITERQYLASAEISQILVDDNKAQKAKEELLTKQTAELYLQIGLADVLGKKFQAALGGAFGGDGTAGRFRTDLNLMPGLTGGELGTHYEELQTQFQALISTSNQVKFAAESIGTAFGNTFTGLITGSMGAREALAGFFQSIANHFADMASQMIAKYIEMQIIGLAQQFLPAIGGIFGAGGAPNFSSAFGGSGGFQKFTPSSQFMPGVPSLVGNRAVGGPIAGSGAYLVGERGPELFMPGRSGTIVPGGGMGGANVTVNVDANGTSVQGDQAQAKQLGVAVSAAVQAELVKQQRPGGLLAGTRR